VGGGWTLLHVSYTLGHSLSALHVLGAPAGGASGEESDGGGGGGRGGGGEGEGGGEVLGRAW
jgi:hypothetical protein